MTTITLDRYADVRDAFRQHDLRQDMYDAGGLVMADCLLVLHGAEHRVRRRVENRLFRRGTFRHWEHSFLRDVVRDTLVPFVAAGRGDLVEIGYRTVMNLTAMVAGVDRPTGSDAEMIAATDELYRFAKKFSEGATLVHTTRDPREVQAEVQAALDEFDATFLQPSIARRQALLARFDAGEITEDELPRDVLTALLRHRDELGVDDDVIRRECAFYLQAGSHSTANAFTHAAHDYFTWSADRDASTDPALLQRCVYESLRLHPASPVAQRRALAPIRLRGGTEIAEGTVVVMDLAGANRDAAVFDRPLEYDPLREVPDDVPRWGHAFGGGMHACIGTELAGGVPGPSTGTAGEGEQVLGTVTLMLGALLAAGGHPDPDGPAERDPHSAREHFGRYPVAFPTS
ncbi:cytochrome P450 [Pseudonocardia sp. GCM10023141]|uniref:cytochrome P450 n=1 Tax=Pseudonocardia sp. GCM10023141 TaxID=3252653 RepID=UPI003609D67D